jgi:hypothetical protein
LRNTVVQPIGSPNSKRYWRNVPNRKIGRMRKMRKNVVSLLSRSG